MKVVVNKHALTGLVDALVNEDRSFHSKNVNEIEKALPPIFPQDQMAQQLTQDKVPVDDPVFMPTNKTELGKAAMQLTDKVMDEKIEKFYTALKRLVTQNSESPGTLKLRESVDKAVKRILSEVDETDDLSDEDADRLLASMTDDKQPPAMKAYQAILDKLYGMRKEEFKKIFYTLVPSTVSDSDKELDPTAVYLGRADEIPREDADNITDEILSIPVMKRILADNGVTEDDVRPILYKWIWKITPQAERVTLKDLLELEAGKIVDMIYLDNKDTKDDFVIQIRDKRMELLQTGEKQDKQLANKVGEIAIKYLEKFKKKGKYEEAFIEDESDLPAPPKVKVLKSPRQLAVYSDMIEQLVELRIKKPKEFINIMNGIGQINVNGKNYDLRTFSVEDFDNLTDEEISSIFRYLAINADKQTWGPSYRWVQNLERTLGMKMMKDNDYLQSYEAPETEPGKFKIQALPWKALPDNFVETFYDTCIADVIRGGIFKQYSLDFQEFMSGLAGDEKLEIRKAVKDILYKILLQNRDAFSEEIPLWYAIHDNPKMKDVIFEKYKVEIDLINNTGFVVEKSEIDQYFQNIKSASLDIYHLVNGLLYSIALKHMHELVTSDVVSQEEDPAAKAQKFEILLNTVKKAYSNDDYDKIVAFIEMFRRTIPARFKKKITYADILDVPWEQFYGKFKEEIDNAISKKIKSSASVKGSVSPEALTFFDDLVNLTKSEDKEIDEDYDEDEDGEPKTTIGDDIENVRLNFADLLNEMMGAGKSGKTTTYSTVPGEIGVYIMKALKRFAEISEPDVAQFANAAITGFTTKDNVKQVGSVTIQDPKGLMKPKIKESTMEYILSRLLEPTRKTRR